MARAAVQVMELATKGDEWKTPPPAWATGRLAGPLGARLPARRCRETATLTGSRPRRLTRAASGNR
jgi:hypothetical protein